MQLEITRVSPIFRILDENEAREFYVDYLGFTIEGEHRFAPHLPLYMFVKLGNFELHLSEHTGDCSPHSAVYLEMENLREYHKILCEKESDFSKPKIGDSGFGTICMDINDPFQNRLSFNERINP